MLTQRLKSRGDRARSQSRRSGGGLFRPRLEFLEDRTLLDGGQLDPTFGTGGKVLTDFPGTLNAIASAVVMQADGKAVMAGTTHSNGKDDFALVRYNSSGSLDPTFGSGGKVLTDFGKAFDSAKGVIIQADSKIVVVGSTASSNNLSTDSQFAMARYNLDGMLDLTFGAGGKVTTAFASPAAASGVALQTDGKIILVGIAHGVSIDPDEFVAARYNADGSLDTTFGTGGKVITSVGAVFQTAVAIQADGKIVVGGGRFDFALVRYNMNGSLDAGFGTGGIEISNFNVMASALALQPDGKIVLGGGTVLARYKSDGTPDGSFGTGGHVNIHFAGGPLDSGNGVALQPDAKIIVVGRSESQDLSKLAFGLTRYKPDGSLDTGYGTNGIVTTNFVGGDQALAVALQGDGQALAAGVASSTPFGQSQGFAVARYHVDGTLDPGFGTGGKVLTPFIGTVSASAHAMALQADGKIVVVGDSYPNGSAKSDFNVARYNPDGSLDSSFGTGGKIATDFSMASAAAQGVGIQSNGKIVVVGRADQLFAMARYNMDGSLDASFGTGGKVTTDFGSSSGAQGLVIQPDVRLVVWGIASSHTIIARFNNNGALDLTYGVGGKVILVNSGASKDLVFQGDGKIVAVWIHTEVHMQSQHGPPIITYSVFVARFDSMGNWNAEWTGVPSPPGDAVGLALQQDGKILVSGPAVYRLNSDFTTDSTFTAKGGSFFGPLLVQPDAKIIASGSGFGATRLKPDGSLDPTFGTGGSISTDFGTGTTAKACAVLLQPDERIVVAGMAQSPGGTSHFALARYLTANVDTANQRFVEDVYWDLLRRPVDPSGLAGWSGLLDAGVSRTQVAIGIQNSLEYRTLVVQDLYNQILGRSPDPGGQTGWVSFLTQGGTAEQLEAILFGSDEFFITHGSDNNKGFLPDLYQTALQRPIDPGGAQGWGQALQSGALSRQAVAVAILASLESDRLEVQGLYRRTLRREPDSGGLDAFTNLLQKGVPNELVQAIFIGSDEYFAKV